jgi:hypothetical protein
MTILYCIEGVILYYHTYGGPDPTEHFQKSQFSYITMRTPEPKNP